MDIILGRFRNLVGYCGYNLLPVSTSCGSCVILARK